MTATIILGLGLLIFLSHVFNALFSKTKVPNVLFLLLIGIVIGPIAGWIDVKEFMGEFGSVFTSVTLVVIMFESGIHLKFADIKKAIGPALGLTFVNFIAGALIATLLANVLLGMDWLAAIYVGAIIGGTSSAVVIPMVNQLKMSNKTSTVLYLESALSDVLCLVVGLAILAGLRAGEVSIGGVFSQMWKSFLFAFLIGIAAGILWSFLFRLLRNIKNSMFTSMAFVFVLYGFVEMIGLNGGIAALTFGIILGNTDMFRKVTIFKRVFHPKISEVTGKEKSFFGEIVFILQTYFFVYVGMSIQFGNLWTFVVGLVIVGLIILFRPLTVRLFGGKGIPKREKAIMSILTPKGLVPAVLASIPLQEGLANGDKIQDLGYSIVLFSIVICSILVIVLSKKASLNDNDDSDQDKISTDTQEPNNNTIEDDKIIKDDYYNFYDK